MLGIIDYGMGNLTSVARSFEVIGVQSEIVSDPADIGSCTSIVLPGVGAFGDAMQHLNERQFVEPLRHAVLERKVPFLGICLGMQLLADVGLEHGEHQGLGLMSGRVIRFDSSLDVRIPHVGWNDVQVTASGKDLFAGLEGEPCFYFVHSYHFLADAEQDIVARCDYGQSFVAAVHRGNVMGVQFHPEKSQKAGLQLLRNFVEFAKRTPEAACATC